MGKKSQRNDEKKMPDSSKFARLSVNIPMPLKYKFKAKAASEGKEMTEKTLEFIENYVKDWDRG